MLIQMNETDRTKLAALMAVKAYVDAQAKQAENGVYLMLKQRFGIDVRKEDWAIDARKGTLKRK